MPGRSYFNFTLKPLHLFKNLQVISIAVGESCDIKTASVLNSQGAHKYCAASTQVKGDMK